MLKCIPVKVLFVHVCVYTQTQTYSSNYYTFLKAECEE